MAEYINIEKPFLDKLQLLGWKVINRGQGIPQESGKSLRSNFKEVVLPKVFKESIKAINLTADGRAWLTDKQLDEVFFEIQNFGGKGLHEATKEMLRFLLNRAAILAPNLCTFVKNTPQTITPYKSEKLCFQRIGVEVASPQR